MIQGVETLQLRTLLVFQFEKGTLLDQTLFPFRPIERLDEF